MCSIAGIIGFENGADAIRSMREDMLSRGPDGGAVSTIGTTPVRLGHNRLAVLDLTENSSQPIQSEDGRYVMVFNGEVYNFKSFGNYASDTLMLIDQISSQAWFSDSILKKLEGMFAIAVWDTEQQTLHLATDLTGQKPLYYYHDENTFAFASTPGALTHLKGSWELDREALDSLFTLGSVCGERSLFKGINKLPGSYMATFDLNTGEFKKKRWTQIQPVYGAQIEELVVGAIESVKVADVPVNIFLSGGIDSTMVATRFKGHNAIHLESEEGHHAASVAAREDIFLHVCPVEFNKQELLEDYARKTGDCAMSAIQPYLVSKAAKQFGKVAVIANGADELFYGYPRTHSRDQVRHMMRRGNEKYIDELFALYPEECELLTPDQFERFVELRMYIQNDLNKTLDFASMCSSVEVRSPFLDSRLVNASMGIRYEDHHSKQYGGKHILKSMLAKLGYSKEFLTRQKIGFSLPAELQYSNDAELAWCVDNGFIKVRNYTLPNDKYHARDMVYLSSTAAAFKAWWQVWNNKIK